MYEKKIIEQKLANELLKKNSELSIMMEELKFLSELKKAGIDLSEYLKYKALGGNKKTDFIFSNSPIKIDKPKNGEEAIQEFIT